MIYVHIPFCNSFCVYCAFYSELAAKFSSSADCGGRRSFAAQGRAPSSAVRFPTAGRLYDFGKYVAKLSEEISARAGELRRNIKESPATLYFGGGTPSLLSIYELSQILSSLDKAAGGKLSFEEFTFEANPEDILSGGEPYVRALLELGVNRFSLGVQSFDDSSLKWMNRRHSAKDAEDAFRILRSAGAENVSLDLIFGLPKGEYANGGAGFLADVAALKADQDAAYGKEARKAWSETLKKALELRPEHISAYSLSLDEGCSLEILEKRGRFSRASDDFCGEEYEQLCALLREVGYEHYEVSNFALPGKMARHNSAYWDRVPYIGFGAGAHSFDGKVTRSWNSDSVLGYLPDYEILTEKEAIEERIMLSLRAARGIEADFLRKNADAKIISALCQAGSLELIGEEKERFRIPENRFFVSDDIISSLI